MLLATANIGRKLLLSYMAMAMLVMVSALIGVSGFSLVAKTEKNVVDSAIPAMMEARQVSELSARIISSVQMLSSAKNEKERQDAGHNLFAQLELLLSHIEELGDESFDFALVKTLEKNVQNIINNLAELGISVERKLWLSKERSVFINEMRVLAKELEQLTRTQVQNTATISVANVTHIYELLNKKNTEEIYQALDNLVEVDLDLAERLHELHLLAYKILNQIEEANTLKDEQQIKAAQSQYEKNLKIMDRRVMAVENPTRSEQMAEILSELSKRQLVYAILKRQFDNEEHANNLMQQTLTLFTELNNTVNKLVDDANKTTLVAADDLTNTLKFAQWSLTLISIIGLVIVFIILWKVVYVSVIKRLTEYSAALLSVARGNLAVELEIKGNDELAHMGRAIITARNTAKAFKVVAESEARAKRELQEHKAALEELIEQRTSELKLANYRLNEEVLNHAKARNAAEQANRAKSAFLATISHEIRTPMNGVLGTARLLIDSGLNSIQERYAEVINRSGKNLLAILNDVLDYSKIEAGHLEIRNLGFDLHQMIEDTYQLMSSRAQEKSLMFTYHIEDNVGQYWKGDVIRLSQVLNNLVGNAIKFTEQGKINIQVQLNPKSCSEVLFEVIDTGIGIAHIEQKNLFDPFTQAEGGANQMGGTGLGLAISRRIIQAIGGELNLESARGVGSRFWFSVPLEVSEPIETGTTTHSNEFIRAKVLLVEDNPVNRLVAEGFLLSLNHEVVMAENGAQAEDIIMAEAFDIALVDINLPDCNGSDLIHRLRDIDLKRKGGSTSSSIPMVAVSAQVFAEEVENYLNSGFDGYLPKPVEKEALASLIFSMLEGKPLLLPQEKPPVNEEGNTCAYLVPTTLGSALGKPVGKEQMKMLINPEVVKADMQILGQTKMQHIIELFEESSVETLDELEHMLAKKQPIIIKDLAHKLKGSAGSLGLQVLMDYCQYIEAADEPLAAYLETKNDLRDLFNQSLLELKALLKSTPK
ncbi:TMAO reductase system sensor histidine kinase/response regulator TorS [Vibrio sagamiensis]|uniref:Sensory/regulatory protein RpfC n=1 Tax=Vibrio sagamiensis NBRC 104589 TaxID=1219064 RepID=A0A511QF11_9VIBR|nr:TMAO reductase system sensor histidine kinase/response regulator TorS [Vibrio sagamiensis]PNQ55569.1 TMAO reductase system sensor histidine kinase/response regulator TorS [Vibrio agarivorans]GEM75777.1 histidine kinase [Vibrio sagamiensis NBRC 104589]